MFRCDANRCLEPEIMRVYRTCTRPSIDGKMWEHYIFAGRKVKKTQAKSMTLDEAISIMYQITSDGIDPQALSVPQSRVYLSARELVREALIMRSAYGVEGAVVPISADSKFKIP